MHGILWCFGVFACYMCWFLVPSPPHTFLISPQRLMLCRLFMNKYEYGCTWTLLHNVDLSLGYLMYIKSMWSYKYISPIGKIFFKILASHAACTLLLSCDEHIMCMTYTAQWVCCASTLLISISLKINATWMHPRLFFITCIMTWHLVELAKVVLDRLCYTIIIVMWSTNPISQMIL